MAKDEQINIRCSKETKDRFDNLKKHVEHINITALMIFEDGLTNYENKFINKNEKLNHIRECIEIKASELKELQDEYSIIDAEIKREQDRYKIDFDDEMIQKAYSELKTEYDAFCDERAEKNHDVELFISWRQSSFQEAMERNQLQKNHKVFTDGFIEYIKNN